MYLLKVEYWGDINNRRKVFEKYAREAGFDPLIPSNWYSQSLTKIMSIKVENESCFIYCLFYIFINSFFLKEFKASYFISW